MLFLNVLYVATYILVTFHVIIFYILFRGRLIFTPMIRR